MTDCLNSALSGRFRCYRFKRELAGSGHPDFQAVGNMLLQDLTLVLSREATNKMRVLGNSRFKEKVQS